MLEIFPTISTSWDISKKSKNKHNTCIMGTHVLSDTSASISRKEKTHKVMCSMKEIWPYLQITPRNRVLFKTKYFWVSTPNFPKKAEKNSKFRISTLEYPYVLSFIWSNGLWSFGTSFVKNRYFGNRIWENNCQIQNQHLWVPLCTEFHLKQSTVKFRNQRCFVDILWIFPVDTSEFSALVQSGLTWTLVLVKLKAVHCRAAPYQNAVTP